MKHTLVNLLISSHLWGIIELSTFISPFKEDDESQSFQFFPSDV